MLRVFILNQCGLNIHNIKPHKKLNEMNLGFNWFIGQLHRVSLQPFPTMGMAIDYPSHLLYTEEQGEITHNI